MNIEPQSARAANVSAVADAMFARLFDYAGLFPPAGLAMREAAANYAEHLQGPDAWMLGRFVIPAARLGELAEAAMPFAASDAPWELSVVVRDWNGEMPTIAAFAEQQSANFRVAAAETRDANRKQALPDGAEAYVELPADDALEQRLRGLGPGERAKIRTGGLEAKNFPTALEVGQFLATCAASGAACKATAGLHHPFPSLRPTCDAKDAPQAAMHGFVNMVLAAALLNSAEYSDDTVRLATELITEPDVGAFRLEPSAVHWRDSVFTSDAIRAARRQLFIAIGSCSFDEPRDDLRAADWL